MNNGLHSIQARGGGMEAHSICNSPYEKFQKSYARVVFFCKFMNARYVLQVFGVNSAAHDSLRGHLQRAVSKSLETS